VSLTCAMIKNKLKVAAKHGMADHEYYKYCTKILGIYMMVYVL
jgi:hypothetical protein